MSTSNALLTNLALMQKLTEAALAAIKAGMSRDDVLAAVQKVAELIESSDDD